LQEAKRILLEAAFTADTKVGTDGI
jgi:hypothetical protein